MIMAMTPNIELYIAWQKLLRQHPHGVMTMADAARLLGTSHQQIDYWCQSDIVSLHHVTLPGYKPGLIPTDSVLNVFEKIQIDGRPDLKRRRNAKKAGQQVAAF